MFGSFLSGVYCEIDSSTNQHRDGWNTVCIDSDLEVTWSSGWESYTAVECLVTADCVTPTFRFMLECVLSEKSNISIIHVEISFGNISVGAVISNY